MDEKLTTPDKSSGAGRPRRWENPALARTIVDRLNSGVTMRQVADELGIGNTTLRGWEREGKKHSSGPLHDIAIAIELSKLRRGLIAKGPQRATASVGPAQSDLRIAQVAGTPEQWSSVGLLPEDGTTISPGDLHNRCMASALEAAQYLPKRDSSASDQAQRARPGDPKGEDINRFEVVKAAFNTKRRLASL